MRLFTVLVLAASGVIAQSTFCTGRVPTRWPFFGSTSKLNEIVECTKNIQQFIIECSDSFGPEKIQKIQESLNQLIESVSCNTDLISTNADLLNAASDELAAHDEAIKQALQALMLQLQEFQPLIGQCNANQQEIQDISSKIDTALVGIQNLQETIEQLSTSSTCQCQCTTQVQCTCNCNSQSNDVIGMLNQVSTDPENLSTPEEIDDANLTVIQLLKTIYRKLIETPIS